MLILEGPPDRRRDERTPTTAADARIEPSYVRLIQGDVHTHGHTLAHMTATHPLAWTLASLDDFA